MVIVVVHMFCSCDQDDTEIYKNKTDVLPCRKKLSINHLRILPDEKSLIKYDVKISEHSFTKKKIKNVFKINNK